eukprot:FR735263.1.p1 GENE.FR735263.1~~FR735263.1.p1  ORF type:complete len:159 (-),score=65.34 FR735263.1:697-1173(-)
MCRWGPPARGFSRSREKGGPGEGPSPNINCEFCSLSFGPPPGLSLFFFSGFFLFWGNFGRGETFSPQETVLALDYPQGGNLPSLKGNKKREFPPGGGRFETRGSPWFGTLLSIHGARFFFFFFFFFCDNVEYFALQFALIVSPIPLCSLSGSSAVRVG